MILMLKEQTMSDEKKKNDEFLKQENEFTNICLIMTLALPTLSFVILMFKESFADSLIAASTLGLFLIAFYTFMLTAFEKFYDKFKK